VQEGQDGIVVHPGWSDIQTQVEHDIGALSILKNLSRFALPRMNHVSHEKKIAGVALAILDPIRKQSLNVETKPFEEGARTLMVSDHLGNNFS